MVEHINGWLGQEEDTNLLWLVDSNNHHILPVAEIRTRVEWRWPNPTVPDEEWQARADRIIACWNACHDAGMSTKALEDGVVGDLLAACEAKAALDAHFQSGCIACATSNGKGCLEQHRLAEIAWELNQAAIAKARGT